LTEVDLDGILELQAANQIDRGGTLSASPPRSRVAAMMQTMPLIVARRDYGQVTGFLMTSTRAMNADLAIFQVMFAPYHGTADAYAYGPVYVSAEERGKRLTQAMFMKLRSLEPGREGVLFILRDNEASLRAHARMDMREVAGFRFNGFDFAVFSYRGKKTHNTSAITAKHLNFVDERRVGTKPTSLSFAQAAAIPLTGITAWQLLRSRDRCMEGKCSWDGLTVFGVEDVDQPPLPRFSAVDLGFTPCVVTADSSFRIVA
jgi:L-amino acid N-acyltransferase YncA